MPATMAMRSILPAAAAALAVLSVPGSAAPAAKVPAAKVDWTRTVSDTGIGWRMGNPKAATRLVEYGSFNCSHCAAFEKAAMPAIRERVAAGTISFEFRPKQLFPHDPSATLLALCAGKDRVFAFTEDYMASAPGILEKLRTAYKADKSAFDQAESAGSAVGSRFLARTGDMAAIAQRHGVTAAQADQCLGDPKLIQRVEDNEAAALAAGVTGTPTFFVNDKRVEPADLAALGIPFPH